MNYLKLKLLLILIVSYATLSAQSIEGEATYKSAAKVNFEFDSTALSPDQMLQMKQELQRKMQKDFQLVFKGNESHWKQIASLNGGPAKASANGMEIVMMSGDENDLLYKNLQAKTYKRATELMGKRFLVVDELPNYEWKLVEEFKKIGAYTCQKAEYLKVSDAKTFSSGSGEMLSIKDTAQVTAWFTPQISVSHGPRNYHGLPGLILELKTGNYTLICTKIVLNPDKSVQIEIPDKGKKVSKEEYDKINEEKMVEMMNRYRGDGDGEIEITIGG